MRVLLDTNVLVAAFATRGFCRRVFDLVLSQHQLVVGETNLTELERILLTKLRMPEAQVEEVVATVTERAEVVAPTEPANVAETRPGRSVGCRRRRARQCGHDCLRRQRPP